MGGLAIARVGYGTWLKFVWPVLLLLAILSIVVLIGRDRAPMNPFTRSIGARRRRSDPEVTTTRHRHPAGPTSWHSLTTDAALEAPGRRPEPRA